MDPKSSPDSRPISWIRSILGPLVLIILCPPLVMLVGYTNVSLDGSVAKLFSLFANEGLFPAIYNIWRPCFFGTPEAWRILAVFIGSQLLLMKLLPGKEVQGLATSSGNAPVYKANGTSSFLCTLGLFYLGSSVFGLFSPGIIHDNFGGLLGALNVFSLFFCVFLYLRGRFKSSGAKGNAIIKCEPWSRIFGWDVRMFTSCRFGMMGWGLILLSFACKQSQLHGISDSMLVAVSLQLLYITKFFWWEAGYLRSMDIMYDRAGFFICWGSMVWLPAIYTSPTLFLVHHPNHLGIGTSIAIFVAGSICIFINYLADRQRHFVRLSNGKCTIWMKKPDLIFANYKTEWGEEKQSLLLASGWWGISRHFHYLPEILAAFFWSLPALFGYYLPWFYLTFLIILLVDRSYRQEKRCAMKYGQDWQQYCEQVPFRLIPYLY